MSNLPLFPRTLVGGLSLPRLIVGTNWFLGYTHTSLAKDKFIEEYQTRDRIAAVLTTFLELGVDAVMGPVVSRLDEAVREAEQCAGRAMLRLYTPWYELNPAGEALANAARLRRMRRHARRLLPAASVRHRCPGGPARRRHPRH